MRLDPLEFEMFSLYSLRVLGRKNGQSHLSNNDYTTLLAYPLHFAYLFQQWVSS